MKIAFPEIITNYVKTTKYQLVAMVIQLCFSHHRRHSAVEKKSSWQGVFFSHFLKLFESLFYISPTANWRKFNPLWTHFVVEDGCPPSVPGPSSIPVFLSKLYPIYLSPVCTQFSLHLYPILVFPHLYPIYDFWHILTCLSWRHNAFGWTL